MKQEGNRLEDLELQLRRAEVEAARLEESEAREAHLRQVLSAIRRVSQLIVSEDDPQRLIERACADLTETMGYLNAWIALLDEEGRLAVATASSGFDGTFDVLAEGLMRGKFPPCMRQTLQDDAVLVVHDPETECTDCPLSSRYGVRAGLSRRLRHGDQTWGVLAVSVPSAYANDAEEQALFAEVAEDLAFGLRKIKDAEARRTERERLAFVIEATGTGTWEWNVQTGETVFNESWAAMLGYTLAELGPISIKTWFRLTHPDDVRLAQEALDQCFTGARPGYECEYRMSHKDGHWVWVLDRGQVMQRDEANNPLMMFGTHTDITERKQNEDALRVSESRLREAQQLAGLGHWYWKVKTGDVEWSQEVFKIFGLDPAHFRPQIDSIMALSPWPDDRQRAQEIMEKATRSREQGHFEQRFLRPDGSIGYYVSSFEGIYDGTGELIAIRGTVQDISERKHAEEALRESDGRFQRMLSVVPDMISIHDAEMNIVYSNWQGFAAVPREQRLCNTKCYKTYRGLDAICPDCAARIVFDTREPMQQQTQLPDGRWVDLRIIPLLDADGNVELFLEWVRDISQEREAEAEREQLQEQLTQAQRMESVGRLAGGVAHDFNNMLNVILGHAEMAMDDLPVGHPLRSALEQIRGSAVRSADLTRQLLAFARRQTVAPKVLNLNDSIGSMLKMLGRLIGEDIDLLWRPANAAIPVYMDPSQIDQMLANLCVNARDAIDGVGKITIEVGRDTFDEDYCATHLGFVPGDYASLAVSDDGCGMDEETRAQVFEPFFTTKGLGKGTGLGLATVYGIVKQNAGFINVYSEPGHGTTFRIYLPIHASAPPLAQAAEREAAPKATGTETILLVEDEPALLKLTAEILTRQGYQTLTAPTPSEALRLAREHAGKIHLLITDVVMPEMNGRELAEHLLDLYPGLKRLFMSGYTANVIAHHGVLDEGVNFIQKPISPRDLGVKVREVLGKE